MELEFILERTKIEMNCSIKINYFHKIKLTELYKSTITEELEKSESIYCFIQHIFL